MYTANARDFQSGEGIRIPKELLREADIAENDPIELFCQHGTIVIRKRSKKPQTFEELFEGYTGDYRGEAE